MNNPVQLVRDMRNPQVIANQMMKNPELSNNKLAQNAYEMCQKGDSQGINEMINNLCKERGITRDSVIQQVKNIFGIS